MGTTEQTVAGEVLRLTYHDETTAFTVAKLMPHRGGREIAIVGYMPMIQVGQQVRCTGTWQIDPKHGKQFSVQKLSYELPTDPSSIQRLIASGFLKGIGPVFAEKIVRRFGAQTFSVLDQEPERLYEIEGLGKRRADQAIDCWKSRTEQQELFVILCNWGISQSMALKILKKWGNNALQVIKNNPYQLAKEIHGIGFQVADKIAERLGIEPTSNVRIDAAIEYLLWELSGEGHTCSPMSQFLVAAEERMAIPSSLIEQRIVEGFKKGDVVLFTPSEEEGLRVAVKRLFSCEQHIAMCLHRLMKTPSRLREVDVEKAVAWAGQTLHMEFADKQKEAIGAALKNKVTILTGGPGTGKSTITRAIVTILLKLTTHIVLVAPTGRAAKRLQEMTGRYSQTIHRLLKFNPGTGAFDHNALNPILCDLLIVDEASMVDTNLAASLLEAVPSHARLLLVGDVDQLPSIGPGTVLHDLIDSEKIPTVRLIEIYRQARHSKIIENAHRINHGQMPFLKNDHGDFFFFKAQEPHEIRACLLDLVTKRIPDKFGFDPRREIQVLAPMRRGECGIEQLNIDFQAFFSKEAVAKLATAICEVPAKDRAHISTKPIVGTMGEERSEQTPSRHEQSAVASFAKASQSDAKIGSFLVNDKVIQLKNNYQKEVFNGDIGFVREVDTEGGQVCVEFDEKHVFYDPSDLDELSLAWAVSVHKYQGSECPCVVIPVHTQHFKLLNRNLLYTAVTRGKKLVILVGSPKAIAIAVHQENTNQRWTNLKRAVQASTTTNF